MSRRRWTDEDLNWMKAQHAKGVSPTEIVRAFTEKTGQPLSVARLRQLVSTRAKAAAPADAVKTSVYLRAGELEAARELAADLGYRTSYGRHAGEGNLSDLLAALARGELTVSRKQTRAA